MPAQDCRNTGTYLTLYQASFLRHSPLFRPHLFIHLIQNTFRRPSRADSDAIKRDIKPIYTAVNVDAALAALDELDEKWGKKYPAMIRLRRNS